jgi:hypothetical protein
VEVHPAHVLPRARVEEHRRGDPLPCSGDEREEVRAKPGVTRVRQGEDVRHAAQRDGDVVEGAVDRTRVTVEGGLLRAVHGGQGQQPVRVREAEAHQGAGGRGARHPERQLFQGCHERPYALAV